MALGGTASAGALAGCMGFGTPRSESRYTGYIVDTENESGVIFKNTSIYLKTNPRSSEAEVFYLEMPGDEEMLEKARTALREQRRVTVWYERGLWENPFDAYGDHSVLTDIELHEEALEEEE